MTGTRMRLCVMSLMVLLACRFGAAQSANARLEGVIYDPSGAAVAGAEVAVANASTQARMKTSSTSEGYFIFPSLQPGLYTLSVQAPGFRNVVVSNLALYVGAALTKKISNWR